MQSSPNIQSHPNRPLLAGPLTLLNIVWTVSRPFSCAPSAFCWLMRCTFWRWSRLPLQVGENVVLRCGATDVCLSIAVRVVGRGSRLYVGQTESSLYVCFGLIQL